jgi:hypothetical protein
MVPEIGCSQASGVKRVSFTKSLGPIDGVYTAVRKTIGFGDKEDMQLADFSPGGVVTGNQQHVSSRMFQSTDQSTTQQVFSKEVWDNPGLSTRL